VPHVCAGQPAGVQFRAWEILQGALQAAQEAIKPDIAAQSAYKVAKDFLDAYETKKLQYRVESTLQLSILTSLCAQSRKLK